MAAETQVGVVRPRVYLIVSANAQGIFRLKPGYDYPNSTENYDTDIRRIEDNGGKVIYKKAGVSKTARDTAMTILRPFEFLALAGIRPSLDSELKQHEGELELCF